MTINYTTTIIILIWSIYLEYLGTKNGPFNAPIGP